MGLNLIKWDMTEVGTLIAILEEIKPSVVISSLTGNFDAQIAAHEELAKFLQQTNGRVIFMSTANVFDGAPSGGHKATDLPYPISAYGKFKVTCENLLQNALGDRCLIIRLPKIQTADFEEFMLKHATEGKPVLANLYMNFCAPEDVAATVKRAIKAGLSGILHQGGSKPLSIHEFVSSLGRGVNYTSATLSLEEYCKELGCDNPNLLKISDNGNFYLTLIN